jgi:hypothetical protein
MAKKTNTQKVREAVLNLPDSKLRNEKRNAAVELKEVKELIQIHFADYRREGAGFGLLYLHDLLTVQADAIRQHIDAAETITTTSLESIQITRQGEPPLKAEKRVTREI